ncbi:hypothetical protein INR49_023401, partial [Caranx melampygus]
MEFLEGSRGIYRPIRVALMMQLLSLQQENQIPSWQEQNLWEFELGALMRTKSFLTLSSTAQDYAKILRDLELPGSKLLCPQEVVIEVVPRVLQGFWVPPHRALLSMPSQLLSKLSVGVAKATLDRVCNALTNEGCQANFTPFIRDDMVLSILTEIGQTWLHDVLVNSIKSFSPVLLTEIADVTMRHICEMFQPRSPEVPALLTPEVETPASISEEQQISNVEMNSAVVDGPLSYPAEPAATIQARKDAEVPDGEDGNKGPSLEMANSTELDTFAVVTPWLLQPVEPTVKVEAREDDSGDPSP